MAVVVDTSPSGFTTIRENGRKIIRTSNGTLWVIVHQATDTVPRLRYSTDDGANWATSSTAFPETVDNRDAAWVFCSDGAIYMLYEVADSSEIRVRKGTLNGAHTDITWSAARTVNSATSDYLDIVAHEEGGDTIVHVVYANTTTLCEYKRAVWGSAFGSVTVLTTWSGSTSPRIEFNHTQANPTTVKDSAPHIYVAWFEDNKIMFRKGVYSSGPTWTWNAARTIMSDAKDRTGLTMSFDGIVCVMMIESLGTADALLVLERDAADTTTASLANTPTRNGTGIAYTDMTYNSDRDIEVFHSDSSSKVLQRVTYDRSGSAWGSWVTIDADADDRFPQVKIGYWSGSKDDSVEVIWTDSSPDPDVIMHERFTFERVLDVYRTVTDPTGITDSVLAEKEILKTVNEPVGVTDDVTFEKITHNLFEVTEPVEVTDSVETLILSNSRTYIFSPRNRSWTEYDTGFFDAVSYLNERYLGLRNAVGIHKSVPGSVTFPPAVSPEVARISTGWIRLGGPGLKARVYRIEAIMSMRSTDTFTVNMYRDLIPDVYKSRTVSLGENPHDIVALETQERVFALTGWGDRLTNVKFEFVFDGLSAPFTMGGLSIFFTGGFDLTGERHAAGVGGQAGGS